jgi:hypothetical protein
MSNTACASGFTYSREPDRSRPPLSVQREENWLSEQEHVRFLFARTLTNFVPDGNVTLVFG